MKLSLAAEEVALFFAQMLDHEYTTKKVFRENFFRDWRKVEPDRRFHWLCVCVWKYPLCRGNRASKHIMQN